MGTNATTSVPSYVAGEVLTAADLNVTNSGIPVFADSTARTNGFGGTGEKTLAEGQYAYLEDDNKTYVYDGAAWKEVGGGSFVSYTPTITNGTLGNGTLTARYAQVGNLVFTKILFTLGSTSTVGTDLQFSLPVTAASTANTQLVPVGMSLLEDTGVENFIGGARLYTTTTVAPYPFDPSSSKFRIGGLSATAPFTWGSTDKIGVHFWFEAA